MTFPSVQAGENLRQALGISLLLHFLLLWPSPARQPADEPLPALMATLQPPPAAMSPSTTALRREESRSRPAAREPAPLPAAAPMNLAPAPAVALPQAESAAPSTAAALAAPASAPLASAVPDGNAEGVRQYRLALAVEARRYKRYPPRALDAGVGGTAEVRIEVADGRAAEVTLARPSGDASLDAAALDMMRKAAPRTAVPEALQRKSFAVSLPIVFDPAAE